MVSRRFVGEVLVLLLLLGGVVSLNSGCISSQLTNVWMDPAYTGGPIKTMLVIAVKKNAAARRIWEDALVAELSGHGVSPTPSYKLFPRAIPDTNEVGSAVEQNHIEGVLIVQRLPNQIATYDHPGSRKSVPVTRYDRLKQSYYTVYKEVYEPGYSDTLKVMRHQIDVWTTTNGGQLIWTGTGESLDPTSREAVRNEITGLIAPELARQGIIPSK
ncbi:MAG: hypothetical protein WB699_17505 [Bacteroidota bacterium]